MFTSSLFPPTLTNCSHLHFFGLLSSPLSDSHFFPFSSCCCYLSNTKPLNINAKNLKCWHLHFLPAVRWITRKTENHWSFNFTKLLISAEIILGWITNSILSSLPRSYLHSSLNLMANWISYLIIIGTANPDWSCPQHMSNTKTWKVWSRIEAHMVYTSKLKHFQLSLVWFPTQNRWAGLGMETSSGWLNFRVCWARTLALSKCMVDDPKALIAVSDALYIIQGNIKLIGIAMRQGKRKHWTQSNNGLKCTWNQTKLLYH